MKCLESEDPELLRICRQEWSAAATGEIIHQLKQRQVLEDLTLSPC
jgi:hypothetical protein